MDNLILFELTDCESGESLGLVRVINESEYNKIEPKTGSPNITTTINEEVEESWNEFNALEEHDMDSKDVNDFVEWHNENNISQIERVLAEKI